MATPRQPNHADKEALILQALWKEAAKREAPIEIPCKDAKAAIRRRFTLYNSVKAVKMKPELDPELFEATRNVMVFYKAGSRTILCLGKKDAPEDLQALADSLGLDVAAAKDSRLGDLDVSASQDNLLDRMRKEGLLGGGEAKPEADGFFTKPNPYFKRED